MSEGPRIKLRTARRIAEEIQDMLAPACERIIIAGSIRREKADVGDIELVIEPRYETVEERMNLFDTKPVQYCLLEKQIEQRHTEGILRPQYRSDGVVKAWPKSWTNTSRYVSALYSPNGVEEFKLDMFIQRPDRLRVWGWQLLLRTGPGEGNQLLVTQRQKGGLKPPDMVVSDGSVTTTSGIPIVLETEAQVFEEWHMVYVPPQQRTPSAYIEARRQWLHLNPSR
ncbi:MAG: hypothetical protein K8L91_03345 [Anaerolineae bacterium]|nr:hypothetical protein [Anaerolineae bacterium]